MNGSVFHFAEILLFVEIRSGYILTTHFSTLFHIYPFENARKPFFDVFKEYRNGTFGQNELRTGWSF